MEIDVGPPISQLDTPYQNKKRRVSLDIIDSYSSCRILSAINASLPVLQSPGYFMEPSMSELATRDLIDPGYCSHVKDFTVGRLGYGCVRFINDTDIRWLDLDKTIKFNRHEIVVYGNEDIKPEDGQGLNKPAEVTLIVHIGSSIDDVDCLRKIERKLKASAERQGAEFISFDPLYGEWKFLVQHFSRFGLSDDEEEDIVVGDGAIALQDPVDVNVGEVSDIDEEPTILNSSLLSHTLPAHLGLDPVRMREMRMMMFSGEEEEDEDSVGRKTKENTRSPLLNSTKKLIQRSSPTLVRKTPLALLEYKPNNVNSSSPGTILMAQQNKGLLVKSTKAEGFKLELKHETPISNNHSRNIVDAALFMGRSFRVGWGPNGTLVHTGAPVGSTDSPRVLSSVIYLEKVAIDNTVRDENGKVSEELLNCFNSTLNLHKEISQEAKEVTVGSFKIKLLETVSDRTTLNEICRSYINIIENKLDVPGLPSSSRLGLFHQVMVWELIRVLFSERKSGGQLDSDEANNDEDTMDDNKEDFLEPDSEALPLIRRAQFSKWLQECVCHRVQEEVSSLNESNYLNHIFLLLTGRQLDSAVELAVSKGDVRLACLLSQAGGSTLNRSDIAKQLYLWKTHGMDFSFIEPERVRIFELLSGNIQDALAGVNIDWKRFLGLLMWYQLPPTTPLPVIFRTDKQLLSDGKAPYPVPIYIDEGPVDEAVDQNMKEQRFDLMYYLMLLYASENTDGFSDLKTMFTAFASTSDPLDHHMIWHQRAILEAVHVFRSNDLHVLDMGLVSQLLCLGHCHWAIYVALHMPHRDDFPNLHGILIKEILFQYCEAWSTQEHQRRFIEDLGIPAAWLHEAMAIYFEYYGDLPKALENYIECGSWQKAHMIFTTKVAHSLFLSGTHSKLWSLATSMEDRKSEIENWDLGAGIYISFYVLRSSLQEENITSSELDNLESKNDACKDFFGRLNDSLDVWGDKFSVDARVAYSKMAEEISNLLLSDSGESSTREVQLSCFNSVFSGPVPEDVRSHHLQDAVSLFTCYLAEAAS